MMSNALAASRQIIAVHSKSFAFASRLLPRTARDRAVIVYAWCRRADDAVDLATTAKGHAAVDALRREIDAIYAGDRLDDPILGAFQEVTRTCRIPRLYPEELLAGLDMDVEGTRYDAMPVLLRYCYRVAGTVGLMMCHVLGVRAEAATHHAVHLGVAMQLTNICRDVAEDWERGRLYLPADLLAAYDGAWVADALGGAFPPAARAPVARATAALLDLAEAYYRSGDAGIPALAWRSALAIRTARHVYAAIGARIRAQGCDPMAGRAFVPGRAKLHLAARAAAASAPALFRSGVGHPAPLAPPKIEVRAEDALPLAVEHAVA